MKMCDTTIMKWQCLVLFLFLKAQFGHFSKFNVVFLKHHKTTSDITRSLTEEDSSDYVDNTNLACDNVGRKNKCKKRKVLKMKGKIVGGADVRSIRFFPYHAKYGESCGAAIIHESWVITVAHCGIEPYVVVGTRHLYKGTKFYIEHHFEHPMWKAFKKEHYYDYDYQLLKLKQKLVFNARVSAIKLGRFSKLNVGDIITVTGWGLLKFNGKRPTALQAVRVPVVSKEDCQRVQYPMFRNTLTSRMFCAGYVDGEKDACQGDSGGAAAYRNHLVGLVSFGFECAVPRAFGVYADISKVKHWLDNTTGIHFRFSM